MYVWGIQLFQLSVITFELREEWEKGGGGGGVHQNAKVCDRGCVIADVGTYFFLI